MGAKLSNMRACLPKAARSTLSSSVLIKSSKERLVAQRIDASDESPASLENGQTNPVGYSSILVRTQPQPKRLFV